MENLKIGDTVKAHVTGCYAIDQIVLGKITDFLHGDRIKIKTSIGQEFIVYKDDLR